MKLAENLFITILIKFSIFWSLQNVKKKFNENKLHLLENWTFIRSILRFEP